MTYLKGYLSTNTRLDRKCGKGWEGTVGNCKRVKNSKPAVKLNKALKTALPVTLGVGAIGGALYLRSNGRDIAKSITKTAYTKVQNIKDVDESIENLPVPAKQKKSLKNLAGQSKRFLGESFFKLDKAELLDVDEKTGVTTFKTKQGNLYSFATNGSSLLVFSSEKKRNISKFPQYEMGFRIDESYERPKGGVQDRGKGVDLIRKTKQMFKTHTELMEDDAILRVRAFKGDDAGQKRKSIYNKIGFSDLPVRGDYQWAAKNQGKFTNIPDSQKEYIASLIRGD